MLELHTKGQKDGERKLALWVKEQVTKADILIGHNSTAFDRHYVNGVLFRLGEDPLPPRLHLDTYQIYRSAKLLYQSGSLKNLANVFKLPEKKDEPAKEVWREANLLDEESLARLRGRCESDVRVQAALWRELKPAWLRWKGS